MIDWSTAVLADPHYDLADDVVYLIDITPDSPEYGQARHLDVGNGNYPAVLLEDDRLFSERIVVIGSGFRSASKRP